MRVSVIIPTRGDRPRMMHEAVASVKAQTMKAHEIIIADDGGDLYPRLNRAISKSTGDAYVLLSDDDKLDPLFIRATTRLIDRQNVDIAYTNMRHFGIDSGFSEAKPWTKETVEHDTVAWFTSLYTKRAWEMVGGYDEDVGPFADWSMNIKCFRAGLRAAKLNVSLFWYRFHDAQASRLLDGAECRRWVVQKYGLKG